MSRIGVAIIACLIGHASAAVSGASSGQLAVEISQKQQLRKTQAPGSDPSGHGEALSHPLRHTRGLVGFFKSIPVLGFSQTLIKKGMTAEAPEPTDAQEAWISPLEFVTVALMDLAFFGVIFAVTAYIYSTQGFRIEAAEQGTLKPSSDEAKFNFGLFDVENCCDRDRAICFFSWCCLPVRWADTVSQKKLSIGFGFWVAVLVSTALFAMDALTVGLSTLTFVILAAVMRQKTRKAMGLEHGTASTMLCDCVTWCFCSPCAAAQEAREVQYMPVRVGSA